MDDKDVQAEQVSEETASTEETSKEEPKEEPKEQPFNEEQEARIQQLVSQASTVAKEEGRREMQGIKDREVAAADRRTKEVESAYKSSFDSLDPEVQKDVELGNLRREKQEREQYGQTEQYNVQLKQSLRDEVTALGIDPNDVRVDYADDAQNYFDGRKRFSESTAKILKGKESEKDKVLDDKLKVFEADFRKKYELDNVDTSSHAGADGSDEAFRKLMSDPDHVTTPEDLKRIEKIREKNKGG